MFYYLFVLKEVYFRGVEDFVCWCKVLLGGEKDVVLEIDEYGNLCLEIDVDVFVNCLDLEELEWCKWLVQFVVIVVGLLVLFGYIELGIGFIVWEDVCEMFICEVFFNVKLWVFNSDL